MSTSAPEQPTPGQDQPVQPTEPAAPAAAPPAPPAPAPTPGDGPWAADLQTLFTDEQVRGQVDQFLRSKVQPYTTQLEQQAAAARDAQRLYSDLNENPYDTYVALTTEMFGEEAGNALLAQLQQQVGAQEQQPAAPEQPTPPAGAPADPRVENVINWFEQQQAEQQYDAELARIQQAHPDVNADLFHPFVAAAEGDFDQAYQLYSTYGQQWAAANATAGEQPAAPPTLGSVGQTAPPGAGDPQPKTIADAVDAFVASQRANAEAPPVT